MSLVPPNAEFDEVFDQYVQRFGESIPFAEVLVSDQEMIDLMRNCLATNTPWKHDVLDSESVLY